MEAFMRLIRIQHWETLFFQQGQPRKLAKKELIEFYVNAHGTPTHIWSSVNGLPFDLTPPKLGAMLNVPSEGWCEYVKGDWPELGDLGHL